MCRIECCLSQTSTNRQITVYENGMISYKATDSARYYLRLSKLFANYPVRRDTFSFLSFSNELKLIFRIVQHLYPENTFNLIHRHSKQYFKEKLIIIESFELDIGHLYHFKVEKLAYKKALGFARIGSRLVNFSKQLQERNFKQSLLFIPTSSGIIIDSEKLMTSILEKLISCFKSDVQPQSSASFRVPTVSNMKSSDSYKICKEHIIVPLNPANVNNFHFKNDDKSTLKSCNLTTLELKIVTIDRRDFDVAKVISQVDSKFILISVVVKKVVILYCLVNVIANLGSACSR